MACANITNTMKTRINNLAIVNMNIKKDFYPDGSDTCIICFDKNDDKKLYFKCDKYHNLCRDCFNKNARSEKCPMCKAEYINEYKNPNQLEELELSKINVRNIYPKYIFIHQDFISKLTKKTTIVYSDNRFIRLYSSHGSLDTFKTMFICDNGFLYNYSDELDIYYLAVRGGKYQFWDNSRVYINL